MKKIVKISPFYEPRMWGGGKRLREEFHYDSATWRGVQCCRIKEPRGLYGGRIADDLISVV